MLYRRLCTMGFSLSASFFIPVFHYEPIKYFYLALPEG